MHNSVQSSSVNSSTSNPVVASTCHYANNVHSTAASLPAVTREEKQSRRSVGFFLLPFKTQTDTEFYLEWILIFLIVFRVHLVAWDSRARIAKRQIRVCGVGMAVESPFVMLVDCISSCIMSIGRLRWRRIRFKWVVFLMILIEFCINCFFFCFIDSQTQA